MVIHKMISTDQGSFIEGNVWPTQTNHCQAGLLFCISLWIKDALIVVILSKNVRILLP